MHYVGHGAAEGRKPHPLFEPDYYRHGCPDARAAADPLTHFMESGFQSLSNPHPLFDCEAYLRVHPEVAEQGINPLQHYVESGERVGGGIEIMDVKLELLNPPPWQERFIQAVPRKQLRAQIEHYSARTR